MKRRIGVYLSKDEEKNHGVYWLKYEREDLGTYILGERRKKITGVYWLKDIEMGCICFTDFLDFSIIYYFISHNISFNYLYKFWICNKNISFHGK